MDVKEEVMRIREAFGAAFFSCKIKLARKDNCFIGYIVERREGNFQRAERFSSCYHRCLAKAEPLYEIMTGLYSEICTIRDNAWSAMNSGGAAEEYAFWEIVNPVYGSMQHAIQQIEHHFPR